MSRVHIDELNPETPGSPLGDGGSIQPPSLQRHLAKIDRARLLLLEARTLPEIKLVKDIAEAAKAYAQAQGLSRECQNHAALIALEAAEKGGRLLKECERSKGGEHTHRTAATAAGVSEYRKTIEAAGLAERTAERWQELAVIPPAVKAEYIQKVGEQGEITAAGLLKAYTKTLPVKPKKEDRWVWGEELDNALEHVIFCVKSLQGRGSGEQEKALTEKLQTLSTLTPGLLERLSQ